MVEIPRFPSDDRVLSDGWTPTNFDVAGPVAVRLGSCAPVRFLTDEHDQEWAARRQCFRAEREKAQTAYLSRLGLSDVNELYRTAEARLRGGLLAIGGWDVVPPTLDRDLPRIIERGFLTPGDGAKLRKGEPCGCHSNSIRAWLANKDRIAVITGLALSKDGLWREHSWYAEKGPRGIRIIETTVPRVAYFGYIRRPQESAELLVDDDTDSVALLRSIGSELALALRPDDVVPSDSQDPIDCQESTTARRAG